MLVVDADGVFIATGFANTTTGAFEFEFETINYFAPFFSKGFAIVVLDGFRAARDDLLPIL